MAGLTAAKALSPHFNDIEIIEPDFILDTVSLRKGVPQGNHVHGLLKGGSDALTSLFPNLPDRLEREGAVIANFSSEVRWYINKHWLPRFSGDLNIYFQSRAFLEKCVRKEVEAIENVRFSLGCRVDDFIVSEDRTSVEAVSVRLDMGNIEIRNADLIVDAMGRGSFLPRWLEENGFGTVAEKTMKVGLGYASCFFELADDLDRDWKSILIYPKGPDELRGATLVKVEDNKWLLTLAGYHGDHPPSDMKGYLDFASKLPRPDIFEHVRDAKALSKIKLHKFPFGLRRNYGALKNFPKSLIPVGDSNASLNPLFGQGMSAVALSALSLANLLGDSFFTEKGAQELRHKYFKSLESIYQTPWDLAAGQDFRYPMTEGIKPFGLTVKNFLKDMILNSSSPAIIGKFFEVVHLVESENCFYNPVRAWRILVSQKR